MDVAAAAGVVGGFLQVVFDKYYGSKLEQWAARSGLHGDFLSLKNQLHMVRAMLEAGGGGNAPHNDSLRSLIVELKSAAYAADNVLDEMEYYRLKELVEDTSGRDGGAPSSSARQVVGRILVPAPLLSNPFKRARTGADEALQGQGADTDTPNFDQDAMSSKIKSISCCLEQIAGMVRRIIELDKLVSMASLGHVQPEVVVSLRQTSSFPTETKLFGRDESTNNIINLMLRTDMESRYNNFNVLPIVGIGGVGKTALAQSVYNHQRVVDSFQVRAWACVSDTLDVRRVIADLIDSIDGGQETPKFHRVPSLDATQRTLLRKIEGKRFLIVLDDVWVSSHWEKLCGPFSAGMSGSMVLVTTRQRKIAKAMGTFDSLTLHGLHDNEFWAFFLQCTNITEDHSLARIGRKIALKLYGNPLAAKTMGRFLSENHEEEHWCKFLNRNIWELKQEPDDVMPVLLLSYQHLPLSLQRCFTYCAIFPRGYKFTEQELIFAWMAQGLVPTPGEDQTLEDVGKEYLNELLSCSFFHIIESGHYMIPGLLHDLAQLVAEGEFQATNGKFPISVEACHLYISHSDHARDMGLCHPLDCSGIQMKRRIQKNSWAGLLHLKNLRTIMFSASSSIWSPGSEVVFVQSNWPSTIRLLSLPCTFRKEQLAAVSSFIHLRYLDLRWSRLEELPEAVCKLYLLQVLNIKHCPCLLHLPPRIANLLNFEHLIADEGKHLLTGVPCVGNMTSLLLLDKFCVRKTRGFDIGQLKRLRNLRGLLKVQNLENVDGNEEAAKARLSDKRHLTELWLSWSAGSCVQEPSEQYHVLEGLAPHSNVSCLHITGYRGSTTPSWLASNLSLSSLEYLYLDYCSELEILPPLGLLPHLRKLHIVNMHALRRIGSEFYSSGQVVGFPCLEGLFIKTMPELEDWNVDDSNVFPSLTSLTVEDCPKLSRIPSFLWSRENKYWFPKLGKINIKYCPELVLSEALLIPRLPWLLDIDIQIWGQTVINLRGGCLEVSEINANTSSGPINAVLQLHWLKHVSSFHIWAQDSLSVHPCKQKTEPSACNSEHMVNSLQTSAEKVEVTGYGITDELLSAILENEICPSSLSISDCPQITSLDLSPLRSLKSLVIHNCVSLRKLFDRQYFTALRDLEVTNASSFAEAWSELLGSRYAEWGQVTTSLESLTVDSTLFLNSPLCAVLTSLKKLTIHSDFRVTSLSRQQVQALLLLTSLQDLGFIQCCNLHSLPSELHKIYTLKQLEIDSCPCVESLPNNGLPEKLEKLIIRGCNRRLYTGASMMGSTSTKVHLVDR
uniref:NB-ARC domain-containing protein n=1 Tax=Oryza glumipatula TaxID=40148 RepID=A0A0E0AD05_9ORYZ